MISIYCLAVDGIYPVVTIRFKKCSISASPHTSAKPSTIDLRNAGDFYEKNSRGTMKELEQAISAKQAHFDKLVEETISVALELDELRQAYRNQMREIFEALCDGERDFAAISTARSKAH